MSLISLCSAHGSPGVTTTALALAASWPGNRRCLLVEADPFGGVIGARFGLGQAPGLSSLAAVARRGLDRETVWRHVQQLPGGIPVLVGPASADEALAVLRDLAGVLAAWSSGESEFAVIVDCGRIGSGSVSHEFLARADVTLVATRPKVDQLRVVAHQLASIRMSAANVRLLLIGDRPYGAAEVASTIHAEVAGVIAWDPRTAAILEGGTGSARDVRRSPLVRSAATLAAQLADGVTKASGDVAVAARHSVDVGAESEVLR